MQLHAKCCRVLRAYLLIHFNVEINNSLNEEREVEKRMQYYAEQEHNSIKPILNTMLAVFSFFRVEIFPFLVVRSSSLLLVTFDGQTLVEWMDEYKVG